MSETNHKLCPSSTCTCGSTLLGVVQGDRSVALLNTGYVVDEAFVERATAVGDPEKRFRFANKCIKSGCPQWTGSNCGVIATLSSINEKALAACDDTALKPCIIRDRCRWFSEQGANACRICTYVVTDSMEEGADKHHCIPLKSLML